MTRPATLAVVLVFLLNTGSVGASDDRRTAVFEDKVISAERDGAVPDAFMPVRFAGYTLVEGERVRVDENGIPSVIIWSTGKFEYNPTTVAQWGLGAYARGDFKTARKASDWLVDSQVDKGGFPLNFNHAIPGQYDMIAPWYSAMSQGNAISLLVRMWRVDGNPQYLESARRAFRLLTIPVAEGGLQSRLGGRVWFEMVPDPDHLNHNFNGSVFALLGIHDLATIGGDAEALALWQQGEESLRANIDAFLVRAPYHPKAPEGLPEEWALYDLQVHGVPAVPNYIGEFYMQVHCELLEEMAKRTGRQRYAQIAQAWRKSLSTYAARKRATAHE